MRLRFRNIKRIDSPAANDRRAMPQCSEDGYLAADCFAASAIICCTLARSG